MIPSILCTRFFGIAFILSGFIELFPSPMVLSEGILVFNDAYDLVRMATGVVFLTGGKLGYARSTILAIGFAYVGIAVLGLVTEGDVMLGVLPIREVDRWLNTVLAFAILATGLVASPDSAKGITRATVK